MKYYCIADEDTVRGFRLAGVSGCVATAPADAATAIRQAVALPDVGIIILTEPVADVIRDQVDAIRLEREHPLIVEIPGPQGALPDRKGLLQSVRETVGIPIGLQENP